MTFQNAFELLGRAKPIQNLLKAVVTDVKMWNAFLNNKAVQEFLRQLETGANNVVTNLSSNQQTDNLSIQQWSSGANNIVRTPSINPQTHNDFFSQQQSSAQQESSMTNALAKILGTVIRFVEPILTAFNFFRDYRGGGGGGGGGGDGRGRGRGHGHGGGRGGGGPQSEFYNCFLDDEEELTKNYTEVVFVLAIVLKLSIVLMRFHGIRC
ncbi:protein no-on-transient A-like [Camellia sinensis]|uniref:protein no-on-transient A-like n=1 Tax=Camellia sinensis TaxID=4442 RepID=UPI001035D7A4|nr:protein no-on-transient A-like [Camellia sinensis]